MRVVRKSGRGTDYCAKYLLLIYLCAPGLLLYVDMLYTCRYAREYFVWDSTDGIAENRDRKFVAENGDAVSHLAVNIRHINHTNIHADVAEVVGPLSVDQTVAVAVAEFAVESVCISNWDGSYACRFVQNGFAAIPDAIACRNVSYLENGSFERGHVVDDLVVAWVNAIEPQSEPHHVEVVLREVFDAGRVADVAYDFVAVGILKLS